MGPGALASFGANCDYGDEVVLQISAASLTNGEGTTFEPLLVGTTVDCDLPSGFGPGPAPETGDASCDGRVNSIDAALVLQFNARLIPLNDCLVEADINRDDRINSIDALIILQCSAGLSDLCV
jgi:hypothetical protein